VWLWPLNTVSSSIKQIGLPNGSYASNNLSPQGIRSILSSIYDTGRSTLYSLGITFLLIVEVSNAESVIVYFLLAILWR
jgi:hypothetical protein